MRLFLDCVADRPRLRQVIFITAAIGSFAFILASQLSILFAVHYEAGMRVIKYSKSGKTLDYNLWQGLTSLWERKSYALCLFLAITSGVWPYIKVATLLPGAFPKAVPRRVLGLKVDPSRWFYALAKWALVDVWFVALAAIAVRIHQEQALFFIDLDTIADRGIYMYFAAALVLNIFTLFQYSMELNDIDRAQLEELMHTREQGLRLAAIITSAGNDIESKPRSSNAIYTSATHSASTANPALASPNNNGRTVSKSVTDYYGRKVASNVHNDQHPQCHKQQQQQQQQQQQHPSHHKYGPDDLEEKSRGSGTMVIPPPPRIPPPVSSRTRQEQQSIEPTSGTDDPLSSFGDTAAGSGAIVYSFKLQAASSMGTSVSDPAEQSVWCCCRSLLRQAQADATGNSNSNSNSNIIINGSGVGGAETDEETGDGNGTRKADDGICKRMCSGIVNVVTSLPVASGILLTSSLLYFIGIVLPMFDVTAIAYENFIVDAPHSILSILRDLWNQHPDNRGLAIIYTVLVFAIPLIRHALTVLYVLFTVAVVWASTPSARRRRHQTNTAAGTTTTSTSTMMMTTGTSAGTDAGVGEEADVASSSNPPLPSIYLADNPSLQSFTSKMTVLLQHLRYWSCLDGFLLAVIILGLELPTLLTPEESKLITFRLQSLPGLPLLCVSAILDIIFAGTLIAVLGTALTSSSANVDGDRGSRGGGPGRWGSSRYQARISSVSGLSVLMHGDAVAAYHAANAGSNEERDDDRGGGRRGGGGRGGGVQVKMDRSLHNGNNPSNNDWLALGLKRQVDIDRLAAAAAVSTPGYASRFSDNADDVLTPVSGSIGSGTVSSVQLATVEVGRRHQLKHNQHHHGQQQQTGNSSLRESSRYTFTLPPGLPAGGPGLAPAGRDVSSGAAGEGERERGGIGTGTGRGVGGGGVVYSPSSNSASLGTPTTPNVFMSPRSPLVSSRPLGSHLMRFGLPQSPALGTQGGGSSDMHSGSSGGNGGGGGSGVMTPTVKTASLGLPPKHPPTPTQHHHQQQTSAAAPGTPGANRGGGEKSPLPSFNPFSFSHSTQHQ